MNRLLLACVACVATLAPSLSRAATFEVPGDGGHASGIGFFAGWKCPPNDNISIVVDGGSPIPVASGIRRGDTASACGNSGLNGYISEINFGNLGAGSHHASVRQSGVEFASGTFTVSTFGGSFLSGASGSYQLQNFPTAGKTATIQWSEGGQNFVITGTGATPTPAAQVRYLNSVPCDGVEFTSILRIGKLTWQSYTDISSAYLPVTVSFLGDFDVNNGRCGTFHQPGGFTVKASRRYVIIQDADLGQAKLTFVDEGPVPAGSAVGDTLGSEAHP